MMKAMTIFLQVSPRPTATAESNENGTAYQNSADTYPKVKVSIAK